ncbi:histone-like nucleoid-structuring protein Lsr2 [Actinomyces vulturis]|uniref:histone-like nucleoid-structuring protein Lsr2 n=1 Tax=Actinomyces vulturis TaxID=1857645 RepID=UPI00082C4E99|nr:Lsr2 family protein [Actinomyces vulturis]
MAQKIQTILVDDLDHGEAHETVTFALDGVSYEIDLSDEHAAELRADFAKWTEPARRVSGRRVSGRRRSSGPGETAKIREWAKSQNMTVSERGRVSAEVRDAYYAAQG